MLRPRIRLLLALTIIFSVSIFCIRQAHAKLIPYLDLVIDDMGDSDPRNNQYWYKNVALFSDTSYSKTLSLVDNINNTHSKAYYTDFRVASKNEVETLFQNDLNDIYNLFDSTYNYTVTSDPYGNNGKYSEIWGITSTPYSYDYNWSYNLVSVFDLTNDSLLSRSYHTHGSIVSGPKIGVGAWVVADANQSTIPEPTTFLLVSVGISGFALLKKKYRKQ